MFTIGQFSKVTGLPVKTLRFYHERGLLVPAAIDRESGYRFYDDASLERARMITTLRGFEFSLDEIATILAGADDEGEILEHLEKQKGVLAEKMARHAEMAKTMDRIIASEREAQTLRASQGKKHEPVIKEIGAQLVGGIRINGRYPECGPAFATLGRKLGRHLSGKALSLYYDGEYKEDGADFEPCMPVKRRVEVEGIDVRELSAVRCVTLIHEGPYDTLGRSYEMAFAFAEKRGLNLLLPTREVYIKGPGMIFKGNPKRYLTEIQLPISGAPSLG